MAKKYDINFYSFLGLNLVQDDLYPHYTCGDNFYFSQIKEFWEKAAKNIEKGKINQKIGLYVHIPFCRQKCNYCMCDSYVPSSYLEVKSYLNLIRKELLAFRDIFRSLKLTSLYFGGGSPSFLNLKDLDELFSCIYSNFSFRDSCQVIFEASVRDLNFKMVDFLAQHKVKRLTIGTQSLDPRVIKTIGRPQTKEKFINIYRYARDKGIPYINIDLMAGLEGQSYSSFLKDLELVRKLNADMIHVNPFVPLAHTPFSQSGKQMTLKQKKLRQEMVMIFKDKMAGSVGRIDAEDGAGFCEKASNIQETDRQKENASFLGVGYSSQSHAFGQVWYERPHLIFYKRKPKFKKIPFSRGVVSNLDEEMRHFVVSNLQKGFSFESFESVFNGKRAVDIFGEELLFLQSLGKIKIGPEKVTSYISSRKEYLIFSKVFYSAKRIERILKALGKKYQKRKNYRKKLDELYVDGK